MLWYIWILYLECFETLAPLRDLPFKDLSWMKMQNEIIKWSSVFWSCLSKIREAIRLSCSGLGCSLMLRAKLFCDLFFLWFVQGRGMPEEDLVGLWRRRLSLLLPELNRSLANLGLANWTREFWWFQKLSDDYILVMFWVTFLGESQYLWKRAAGWKPALSKGFSSLYYWYFGSFSGLCQSLWLNESNITKNQFNASTGLRNLT